MFRVANSILHDESLAEDAVQQAFCRILNHLENILSVECPQTRRFVVIIVRNLAINLYHSRHKQPDVLLDELENWAADLSQSPGTAVEEQDAYQRLVALIEQMPHGYRDVLMLRYDQGYSTAQVASMLGLREENVKKRLQRARRKLEQLLKQEVNPECD
ncbi:MAG: sigma-70 family RNA polymerase sigma factor [Anaerotruncus sp.]|nr:sigma-70 family RNA polymerase sigma factor [Anaerotruncus sp.]